MIENFFSLFHSLMGENLKQEHGGVALTSAFYIFLSLFHCVIVHVETYII